MSSVTLRLFIAALVLLVGAGVMLRATQVEGLPIRKPLSSFPVDIGDWRGRPSRELDDYVLEMLRLTEYLNRAYVDPQGRSAGLYIGYYASQLHDEEIHSPLVCLPGAGWQPVEQGRKTVNVMQNGQPRQIEINDFVVQKGPDRLVVQFWYQSRDRVIVSEYWRKVYLAIDAIRHNRTDGAMVRVMVPVAGDSPGATLEAQARATAFVQALFPHLERYLPL